MPLQVAIRCDASRAIGTGHLIRCRNLARALRRRGAEISFLCRDHSDELLGLLDGEYPVLLLPHRLLQHTAKQFDSRELYASWLGCSQAEDAVDCLNALRVAGVARLDLLVVDHYGLDAQWHQAMRSAFAQVGLLVIDDLADRCLDPDWLLDANRLEATADSSYSRLVPHECQSLLGPAYALLAEEYSRFQPLLPVRRELRRLLVFFGGVDQANLTSITLQALRHPELQTLGVDVVLGAGAPHRASIERELEGVSSVQLHVGLPSLAGLMARADLALGAAGTASWERASLGLPTLVVPVAENQRQGAQALELVGAARLLDLLAASDPIATLQNALLALLADPLELQAMSQACLQLGDGRGLARVATHLLGPTTGLRLRTAKCEDEWLYHWWANDPEVRHQSFNSDPIPLADHQRWFGRRLVSPLALLRVLVDADGMPLGQIRFERASDRDTRAVIGFSLDPAARGHGLAPALLQLGVVELRRCWGYTIEAYGEVRSDNQASCRAFLRAGFSELAPIGCPEVRCFAHPALSVT